MDIIIEYDVDIECIIDSDKVIMKSVESTLQHEGILSKQGEVYVTVVDSTYMHKLNKNYRDIDRTTDVLSFPLDMDPKAPYMILGDIFINRDKIIEQASEYGHSVERELAYLTVHSTLHLLGYDHIQDIDRDLMRKKEKEILNIIGIYK